MFHFLTAMFISLVSFFHPGSNTAISNLSSQQNSTAPVSNQSTYNPQAGGTRQATVATQQTVLTQDQLLAMADNRYANGVLPLGNNKYVTDNPKKGYVYLCHVQSDPNGGGAQTAGSWIHGTTWNINQKISVEGSVSWPNAKFSNTLSGETRTLSGNDVPSHTTGIFPIQSSDPAYAYDRNPNYIKTQSFTDTFPAQPTYSNTPYCMGGEAGIMLTGVALFNAFDAGLRDAAAYEVQDGCNGHPQVSEEYHYHSLSSCIKDTSETTVIGYALDGFPITGPKVAANKYLTTDNLDECHGTTSQIMLDGKLTTTYHYVMTQDFPYSVSCFRGKPVSLQVIQNVGNGLQLFQQNQAQQQNPSNNMPIENSGQGMNQTVHPGQPPQAAFTACQSKNTGETCQFAAPMGTIPGTCQIPPNQSSIVCIPNNRPQ